MEFKDLKYGQMFTIAEDPKNVWGKIPLMQEPEDGDPETDEGMVNALLLNGDGEDAVFECFADTQECECLTLEFDEEDETGETITDEEVEKLRESETYCEHSENCVCPYCENSPNFDGDDGGVDPRLVE